MNIMNTEIHPGEVLNVYTCHNHTSGKWECVTQVAGEFTPLAYLVEDFNSMKLADLRASYIRQQISEHQKTKRYYTLAVIGIAAVMAIAYLLTV